MSLLLCSLMMCTVCDMGLICMVSYLGYFGEYQAWVDWVCWCCLILRASYKYLVVLFFPVFFCFFFRFLGWGVLLRMVAYAKAVSVAVCKVNGESFYFAEP